jgi:hypothetical protein
METIPPERSLTMALTTTDTVLAPRELPARSGWERVAVFALRHRRAVIAFWLEEVSQAGEQIAKGVPGAPTYPSPRRKAHREGKEIQ